jgi:hypothetical protein
VLVRLDHSVRIIVNANHSVIQQSKTILMRSAELCGLARNKPEPAFLQRRNAKAGVPNCHGD